MMEMTLHFPVTLTSTFLITLVWGISPYDDHTQPWGEMVAFLLRKLRRMMITRNLPQQAEEDDS